MLSAQTVESFSRSIDSLRGLKKYADALVKVNEVTQIFAGSLKFVKYKGCVLSELGRDDEAITAFNEYLKVKPSRVNILNCSECYETSQITYNFFYTEII